MVQSGVENMNEHGLGTYIRSPKHNVPMWIQFHEVFIANRQVFAAGQCWHMSLILALGREFEGSLVYGVGSRTARTTKRSHVSKQKNTKQTNKNWQKNVDVFSVSHLLPNCSLPHPSVCQEEVRAKDFHLKGAQNGKEKGKEGRKEEGK